MGEWSHLCIEPTELATTEKKSIVDSLTYELNILLGFGSYFQAGTMQLPW